MLHRRQASCLTFMVGLAPGVPRTMPTDDGFVDTGVSIGRRATIRLSVKGRSPRLLRSESPEWRDVG